VRRETGKEQRIRVPHSEGVANPRHATMPLNEVRKSDWRVDCFLGLNVHADDRKFARRSRRLDHRHRRGASSGQRDVALSAPLCRQRLGELRQWVSMNFGFGLDERGRWRQLAPPIASRIAARLDLLNLRRKERTVRRPHLKRQAASYICLLIATSSLAAPGRARRCLDTMQCYLVDPPCCDWV